MVGRPIELSNEELYPIIDAFLVKHASLKADEESEESVSDSEHRMKRRGTANEDVDGNESDSSSAELTEEMKSVLLNILETNSVNEDICKSLEERLGISVRHLVPAITEFVDQYAAYGFSIFTYRVPFCFGI